MAYIMNESGGDFQHTLAQIREEYWIPKGRIEVRSVVSRCVICRKHEGA